MKKLMIVVTALCVMTISGCATQLQREDLLAERSAIIKAQVECIGETAIDAAFDYGDFMYVCSMTRNKCSDYINRHIATYPPAYKMEAHNSFKNSFDKITEEASAFALNYLKDKKEYLDKFYNCAVDRTSKREIAKNIEEFKDISRSEITICYNMIMTPYIGKKDNEYSARRRERIINETTDMQVKILLEEIEKTKNRKETPASGNSHKRPQPPPAQEMPKVTPIPSWQMTFLFTPHWDLIASCPWGGWANSMEALAVRDAL